jgi:prepilin-type N-terminal cleavage/methylation domain-containing protein
MRHRPGVTLVEVLVAIFIMAIGMLALLALFPLGAISMAQALKDDRCAQSAVNAEAFAVAQDMRHDVMVAGGPAPVGAYPDAFGNPFGTVGAISSTLALAPGYTGPSNGVIVDPFTYPLDTTGGGQPAERRPSRRRFPRPAAPQHRLLRQLRAERPHDAPRGGTLVQHARRHHVHPRRQRRAQRRAGPHFGPGHP